MFGPTIIGGTSPGGGTPLPALPEGAAPGDLFILEAVEGGWRLAVAPDGFTLPEGGTTGQIIVRTADGYSWADLPAEVDEVPDGGTPGWFLTKTEGGTAWTALPDFTAMQAQIDAIDGRVTALEDASPVLAGAVDDNAAAIATEAGVRAAADDALTDRLDDPDTGLAALKGQIDNHGVLIANVAEVIVDEQDARAAGDAALGDRIDAMQAATPAAPGPFELLIAALVGGRVDGDAALDARLTAVEGDLAGSLADGAALTAEVHDDETGLAAIAEIANGASTAVGGLVFAINGEGGIADRVTALEEAEPPAPYDDTALTERVDAVENAVAKAGFVDAVVRGGYIEYLGLPPWPVEPEYAGTATLVYNLDPSGPDSEWQTLDIVVEEGMTDEQLYALIDSRVATAPGVIHDAAHRRIYVPGGQIGVDGDANAVARLYMSDVRGDLASRLAAAEARAAAAEAKAWALSAELYGSKIAFMEYVPESGLAGFVRVYAQTAFDAQDYDVAFEDGMSFDDIVAVWQNFADQIGAVLAQPGPGITEIYTKNGELISLKPDESTSSFKDYVFAVPSVRDRLDAIEAP